MWAHFLAGVLVVRVGAAQHAFVAPGPYNLGNRTVAGMCAGNSNSSQDVICPAGFVHKANHTGAPASSRRPPAPPPPLLSA
jgi:hypothetical protein